MLTTQMEQILSQQKQGREDGEAEAKRLLMRSAAYTESYRKAMQRLLSLPDSAVR